MEIPAKELIVVAGPNGAGKTTFALAQLQARPCQYIGADAIAAELCPNDPRRVRMEAGREFVRRIDAALSQTGCYVVESTLSGRTFAGVLKKAAAAGFETEILFVFLDSIDACLARIRERVRKGGHDVPEEDVKRRFGRSIANFWHVYRPLVNRWALICNVGNEFEDVALGTSDTIHVRNDDLYSRFQGLLGASDAGP